MAEVSRAMIDAARQLNAAVAKLRFHAPVTHIYNPLDYAWNVHRAYLQQFAQTTKRVLFLGMNPGPFGMVQTGVPFGEIAAVRDWLKLTGSIRGPKNQHPARPILGFDCPRSEISGQRLWGVFARRFGSPQIFFADHFVANYCPLAFLERSGRNFTPDKLPAAQLGPLLAACDQHLHRIVSILRPRFVIGVGGFAAKRAALLKSSATVGCILHPSPACPAANRDWAGTITRQLQELGAWGTEKI